MFWRSFDHLASGPLSHEDSGPALLRPGP